MLCICSNDTVHSDLCNWTDPAIKPSAEARDGNCFVKCGAAKITIPAVKITPDTVLPLLPDEAFMEPEPCLSTIPIKLEPDDALFPAPEESVDILSEVVPPTIPPNDEFGDFLLDAVDWL